MHADYSGAENEASRFIGPLGVFTHTFHRQGILLRLMRIQNWLTAEYPFLFCHASFSALVQCHYTTLHERYRNETYQCSSDASWCGINFDLLS